MGATLRFALLGTIAVLLAGGLIVVRPLASTAAPTALAAAPDLAFTSYALPPDPHHPWKYPVGIALGPDGNLWFTEGYASAIGRITPAGVVTEFPLPAPAYPRGITRGPDGNLWFVEESGDQVGRITPTGMISEYRLPTVNNQPIAIVAGADGNLWFTEESANQIGRITPGGQVTEYRIPVAGFDPWNITAGPDGNLWFTALVDGIGRITPAGQVTVYPGLSYPTGITSGPDGNLWITEDSAQIGKMTPGGLVTQYPLPAGLWAPEAITLGADGNLWFLASHGNDGRGNELGRITPGGDILTFTLTAATSGTGQTQTMTTGQDGDLWFTSPEGDRIWRVGDLGNLPTPTPTPRPTSTSTPEPSPTPVCPGSYFQDVCRGAWYEPWVSDLVQLGAISGYACGGAGEPCDAQHRPYFRPYADITRGQLTKATIVSAGIPLSATTQIFADVLPANAFYPYINTAFVLNIVTGYDCGGPGEPCDAQHRPYFRPGNSITRGQASKIVALAHGWALLDPAEASFADVPSADPFYQPIETIRAAGTISGYDCGGPGEPCDAQHRPYFRPGNSITRAQAAKILDLARGQAPATPTPVETVTPTPTAIMPASPTVTTTSTLVPTVTPAPSETSTATATLGAP